MLGREVTGERDKAWQGSGIGENGLGRLLGAVKHELISKRCLWQRKPGRHLKGTVVRVEGRAKAGDWNELHIHLSEQEFVLS